MKFLSALLLTLCVSPTLDAASGRKVSEVAADWTGQPGYPLVTAASECDASGNRNITLSQKRFLLEGQDAGHSHWRVPMRVRAGLAAVPQPVLLAEDGQRVAAGLCDQPLSLTPDAIGFYRVAYDENSGDRPTDGAWNQIIEANPCSICGGK